MLLENSYMCINCGTSAKELFKEYSASVLKLTKCVCIFNNVIPEI